MGRWAQTTKWVGGDWIDFSITQQSSDSPEVGCRVPLIGRREITLGIKCKTLIGMPFQHFVINIA